MGKRVGRGTKRRREQERQERAACDARTMEMREKNRIADETAAAATKERATRARAAWERGKKLTDRLAELGYEINATRFLHDPSPGIYAIDDAVLEKLIANLERTA